MCEQCTYPWHDGLCDCGHGEENKENNDLIATLAHSLIKDGHNLDDCHGCMCEEDY